MSRSKKVKKTSVPKLEGMIIDNSPVLELAPKIYEPPLFKQARSNTEVKQFCENFWEWNLHVPWLVYADSQPHKELMVKLISLMRDKVGKWCADFGCGYGEFLTHLLQSGECSIENYFAIDLDCEALVTIPRKLQQTAYSGRRLFLVHTALMFQNPLRDCSVDSVISSLGALMYTWAWFDRNGNRVASNREAFSKGLKDIHRILKPGGYLGISAPLPNPDWRRIRNQSAFLLLKQMKLVCFIKGWWYGTKAVRYSRFMNELEKEGKAHYLSSQEWKQYLEDAGFTIETIETDCFAGQGVIVIARKK